MAQGGKMAQDDNKFPTRDRSPSVPYQLPYRKCEVSRVLFVLPSKAALPRNQYCWRSLGMMAFVVFVNVHGSIFLSPSSPGSHRIAVARAHLRRPFDNRTDLESAS